MTEGSDNEKKIDDSMKEHPDVKKLLEASFKKDLANPKLMEEISELIKSGTVENKILALEKIENCDCSFPASFEFPIFRQFKADPDDRVRSKANEVYYKRYGPYIEEFTKSFKNMVNIYGNTFNQLALDISATSISFSHSQKIAKTIRESLKHPIKSIYSNIFFDYEKEQKNRWVTFLKIPLFSPILKTTQITHPIIKNKDSYKTIPEILGKSESEVERELTEVIEAKGDFLFNIKGYELLFALERLLRNIIHERICLVHQLTITERIDPNIIKRWKKRRTKEINDCLLNGEYRLIDYSDFKDLKDIFENEKNQELFFDLLDKKRFRSIISKLDELEPIRNKIAHSRSLTKREFNKLKIYADDIYRLLKPKENFKG